MQRIEREVLVPSKVPVFIAEDGTEFKKENDCYEYERAVALKATEGITSCEELEYCPNFCGDETPESHSYKWFLPKNANEIELLNNAYFGRNHLDATKIGKWVCIETGYDDDSWSTTLDEGIEYAKMVLAALGYEMIVTKKEEENND